MLPIHPPPAAAPKKRREEFVNVASLPPIEALDPERLKVFTRDELMAYLRFYDIEPGDTKPDLKRQLRLLITSIRNGTTARREGIGTEYQIGSFGRTSFATTAAASVGPPPMMSQMYRPGPPVVYRTMYPLSPSSPMLRGALPGAAGHLFCMTGATGATGLPLGYTTAPGSSGPPTFQPAAVAAVHDPAPRGRENLDPGPPTAPGLAIATPPAPARAPAPTTADDPRNAPAEDNPIEELGYVPTPMAVVHLGGAPSATLPATRSHAPPASVHEAAILAAEAALAAPYDRHRAERSLEQRLATSVAFTPDDLVCIGCGKRANKECKFQRCKNCCNIVLLRCPVHARNLILLPGQAWHDAVGHLAPSVAADRTQGPDVGAAFVEAAAMPAREARPIAPQAPSPKAAPVISASAPSNLRGVGQRAAVTAAAALGGLWGGGDLEAALAAARARGRASAALLDRAAALIDGLRQCVDRAEHRADRARASFEGGAGRDLDRQRCG